MALPITSESRITRDLSSGAVRSWFDTAASVPAKAGFSPAELARQTLADSAELFRWTSDLPDLSKPSVRQGPNTVSVTFTQAFREIRVDSSEVVVDMYADGRVYSVYNNYHYDIPETLDPRATRVFATDAEQLVNRLFETSKERSISTPDLIVYQYQRVENHPPKPGGQFREQLLAVMDAQKSQAWAERERPREGQYFLAWDVIVGARIPLQRWRLLIDAMTGNLIQAIDLAQYATGNAMVFDANPIVSSGNAALRHTDPIATRDAQRAAVAVARLNPPDGAGNLHLAGPYVHMAELENPIHADPANAAGNFNFSSDDVNFLDAMAYFHLDRFQDYVQTDLGLNNVANYSIAIDPQGLNGADNSHYVSGVGISFGGGITPVPANNPVPDAADAMVVLHEYGHAIQDNVRPGFNNPSSGVGEGFGDFLAAVFYDDKHTNPAQTRGYMMSWDSEMGTGSWPGRRYDMSWLFDGPEYAACGGENHCTGQLWCATMFELYRKLGGDSGYPGVKKKGKDLATRLHLQANFNVPTTGATTAQMGQQVEAADSILGGWRGLANGLHKKVIYDTFRRRHLATYSDKSVDVYVNDGREGGYGSLSGLDQFGETLWLDNFWETQDMWVRTSPYASPAAQAAGTPADHIEPPVSSIAYLYARVKNRGTNAGGSGPVTVKAFHCVPGMGLVWPDAWTAMNTPSLPVGNILPGTGSGVVVGPFPWTPTMVGHECVLVIVECAGDHALTQDLLVTDHVSHADLVPFDNNIAQRNLFPTMPKAKTLRGFYVGNPEREARTVQLHFESSLPEGWRWETSLGDKSYMELGPLERRWVEIGVQQAEGREVTNFEVPQTLRITGTINGEVIGGVTFYIAPPSTFEKPRHRKDRSPSDVLNLNVPWDDLEIEGEVEIKLRFRQRED